MSNDREEGCTNVGRTGWHIDGTFQPAPFSHAIYHIVSCPSDGDTTFLPLTEMLATMDKERKARWDRLYMMTDWSGPIKHPLVYAHPETGKEVMCFHLGMTEA